MRPYLVTQPLGQAASSVTLPRVEKQFGGYTYYALDPALVALLAASKLPTAQILSEGALVRGERQSPSVTLSKMAGTPAAGPWMAQHQAAGEAILIISEADTGTLAATRDIALASQLTGESAKAAVLYEPSAGWQTDSGSGAQAKKLPSWVLPVGIGGTLLLLGGIVVASKRKKATPNRRRRHRRRP